MNQKSLFQFNNVESAIAKQRRLTRLVVEESPSLFKPRLLCGLDVAYEEKIGFAAAAMWDTGTSEIIEVAHAQGRLGVEYVPGLLGFREGPLLLSAVKRLRNSPDVFLVDGHGRAHPRRFGLACHVGLALDEPTLGVAKSPFYGRTERSRIVDYDGTRLGRVLRTRSGKLYYVSVGHRVGLDDAFSLVKKCMVNDYPVPLRTAHLESVRLKRSRG